MLKVEYDIKNGTCSPIPDGEHYIVIKQLKKLSTEQKLQFKSYIIQKQLKLTIDENFKQKIDDPDESKYIISELDILRQEQAKHIPKIKDIFLAFALIIVMFMLPIYISYYLSQYIQNHWAEKFLDFVIHTVQFDEKALNDLLFGDYGLLSLSIYSIIWALPVVVFISISTNIVSESHLKSYIVWSIDRVMTKVGLTGYDIVPVIEGFGCNSAAVLRANHDCSACTKNNCISMVSFGSSCSYQIGATLSLFSVINAPWLFIPYLIIVFIGGLIHIKLWSPKSMIPTHYFVLNKVRKPSIKAVWKQSKQTILSFLAQALPIFMMICVCASILSMTPILLWTANIFNPILQLMNAPQEMSTGILFSMIRKDGMLLFNMNQGSLLQIMPLKSVFLLVLFSSTFSACSVTITMIIKNLGWKQGLGIVVKQMITATICLCGTVLIMNLFGGI